jgi:hypothetical protein
MDNYRVTSRWGVQNFESAELDFSVRVYSSSVSFGPRDGGLGTCFSFHSKLEHSSGLGLKANRSSLPLIWNLISPALTCTQEGSPKNEGCFHILLHVKYYKIYTNEKVSYFLPEYFRRFLQGSGPIGRLVANTSM